ncbi:hypothetical protein H7F15_14110 [Pontibacter sp. Tf4]|uniref:hypothetical protein n=1 Tax=Pontibacter sp. Tf4 TaxID=2761620 RepID=UPI0016237E17|nr:hypothetical protein [Pontibacter sp. Tf4]MBB6612180.1 hypothetical protein [Pontibacter sp. Tf4]
MKKLLLKHILTIALVAGLIISFSAPAYSQCAMCRATVESNVGTGSSSDSNEVGSGLNTGILYLMAIPYILVGTIGFMWYRSHKMQKRNAAQKM